MTKILRIFAMLTSTLFVVSLLCSCASTVTPDPIIDDEPDFDNSTPPEYDNQNSGIIDVYRQGNEVKALITQNKRKQYNDLIKTYRLQFQEVYHVELFPDSGLNSHFDKYGNELWIIDGEHLQYLLRLVRWAREGRAPDSIWKRVKEVIQ